MSFTQNTRNYMQVLSTVGGGYIGALIPNKVSNIPHLVLAVIFGSLVSKIIYGDFDLGYQWTKSDVYYWVITIIESLVGGYSALYIKQLS
jgi:hypothetical protein